MNVLLEEIDPFLYPYILNHISSYNSLIYEINGDYAIEDQDRINVFKQMLKKRPTIYKFNLNIGKHIGYDWYQYKPEPLGDWFLCGKYLVVESPSEAVRMRLTYGI